MRRPRDGRRVLRAALAAGGYDNGPPGIRAHYHETTTPLSSSTRTATTSRPSARSRSRWRSFGPGSHLDGAAPVVDARSRRLGAGGALVRLRRRRRRSCSSTRWRRRARSGLADARPVVVVLTCHWHRRSSAELVEALGAPSAARQAKMRRHRLAGAGDTSRATRLPGGVEAKSGGYADEATLWIAEHAARSSSVTSSSRGEQGFRVQPDSWLADGPDARRGFANGSGRCPSFRSSSCSRRTAIRSRRMRRSVLERALAT